MLGSYPPPLPSQPPPTPALSAACGSSTALIPVRGQEEHACRFHDGCRSFTFAPCRAADDASTGTESSRHNVYDSLRSVRPAGLRVGRLPEFSLLGGWCWLVPAFSLTSHRHVICRIFPPFDMKNPSPSTFAPPGSRKHGMTRALAGTPGRWIFPPAISLATAVEYQSAKLVRAVPRAWCYS